MRSVNRRRDDHGVPQAVYRDWGWLRSDAANEAFQLRVELVERSFALTRAVAAACDVRGGGIGASDAPHCRQYPAWYPARCCQRRSRNAHGQPGAGAARMKRDFVNVLS